MVIPDPRGGTFYSSYRQGCRLSITGIPPPECCTRTQRRDGLVIPQLSKPMTAVLNFATLQNACHLTRSAAATAQFGSGHQDCSAVTTPATWVAIQQECPRRVQRRCCVSKCGKRMTAKSAKCDFTCVEILRSQRKSGLAGCSAEWSTTGERQDWTDSLEKHRKPKIASKS